MKRIYNRHVIESMHFLLTYIMPSITVPINDSIAEDAAIEWGDSDIIEDIKFAIEQIKKPIKNVKDIIYI